MEGSRKPCLEFVAPSVVGSRGGGGEGGSGAEVTGVEGGDKSQLQALVYDILHSTTAILFTS